ncbi:GH17148 [Drosophila grimshawi]|uniref:GH17148 n=1 Tax=Drosophila grimshawi TaxID=7222 RepID=B4J0S5_DROGR|nr:GH17148 [Drosophila grimshawi]
MAIDVIQLKCKENKTRNPSADSIPLLCSGLLCSISTTRSASSASPSPSKQASTPASNIDNAVDVIVGGGFNTVVSFNKRKIFSELQQL